MLSTLLTRGWFAVSKYNFSPIKNWNLVLRFCSFLVGIRSAKRIVLNVFFLESVVGDFV
jgi:hypothetical protein